MTEMQELRGRMEGTLEAVRRDFGTVRTGKATPSLLDSVRVEAYGSTVPLNQVGTVSVPEPRMLTVQPWDKSLIRAIERGIAEADLGLNPSNDGNVIRIPIPALTEERRKDFVRQLHRMAEDGRVSLRQARKDANDAVKQRQKNGELSEDDSRREQDEVQNLTNSYVEKVDELLKRKEAEVLEV
ncbi:MAG: ribosome recycling factor [Gemmatimonadota bacterium]|jgi:ribosome recycling factor|nr:ribosome recycling factor [Gemmatimonadota bacterium]